MDERLGRRTRDTIEELKEMWTKKPDTIGSIFATVLEITSFTHYPEIADLAECSPNAAKKHLDRLEATGIVQRQPNSGMARYRRNDSYIEWIVIQQIAEQRSAEEIIKRVRQLEKRSAKFVELFETSDPSAASIYDVDSDKENHQLMESISEWHEIDREIYLLERARQEVSAPTFGTQQRRSTNIVPALANDPSESS